ncbi:hypothetical protein SAMN05444280_102162 [Tangfeifania diversioriginum]|uniref:Uncharacterized protein n=1 Tax=Tangfeifania diversioriginum TaxID=1168035 RepID=A0A1M6BBY5_9BACT|nr:hypothetical protein SAMN05444280_102162 [Tangfeifania diversioriginum]
MLSILKKASLVDLLLATLIVTHSTNKKNSDINLCFSPVLHWQKF